MELRAKSRGHDLFLPDLPAESISLYQRDLYESFESNVTEKLLTSGMAYVDVGASIGHYTLLAAKGVGPSGKVFAFEPNPRAFELLQFNIEINGYQNIVALQKPVSSVSGDPMSLRSPWIEEVLATESDEEIETVSLDDFFKNERLPDFVKIDVDGADLWVWQGMQRILSLQPKLLVFCEFDPQKFLSQGIPPASYLKMISEHNFHIFGLWRDVLVRTSPETQIPWSLEIIANGFLEYYREEQFPDLLEKIGARGMINLLCVRELYQLDPLRGNTTFVNMT